MPRTRALLTAALLFQTACGLNGLFAEIPPYVPKDAGDDVGLEEVGVDATLDAGPSTDARDAELDLNAPTNLTATSADGGLRLTWDAVPSATEYELRIDGGDWASLGDVTEHLDDEAPPPDLSGEVTLTATEGTLRPHVELTATLPQLDLPAERTYEVRARAGEATGEPASTSAAREFDGSWTFLWERSADDGATFEVILTGSETTFTDASASPLGTEATYRVGVTTSQTETVITSEPARGWRLAVQEIMTAPAHTCALLTNGAVKCWGFNGGGQLGYGDTTHRGGDPSDMPTPNVEVGFEVASLSGTHGITCALGVDGDARCWGSDSSWRLGNGPVQETLGDELGEMPPPTALLGKAAQSIQGSANYQCVLYEDGDVACWGNNLNSITGVPSSLLDIRGDDANEMPPTRVPLSAQATQLAVGASFACAKLSTGRVVCWGGNTNLDFMSAIGIFPWPTASVGSSSSDFPLDSTSIVTNPSHLAAGNVHACAIDPTGSVYCWGSNRQHQCGHGDDSEARPKDFGQLGNYPSLDVDPSAFSTHYALNPNAPRPNTLKAVDLQAGEASTCALYNNGAVVCWGSSRDLGTNNDVTTPTIQPIKGLIHKLARAHHSGHHCAIDFRGEALCWGYDSNGQLGYGGADIDLSSQETRITLW